MHTPIQYLAILETYSLTHGDASVAARELRLRKVDAVEIAPTVVRGMWNKIGYPLGINGRGKEALRRKERKILVPDHRVIEAYERVDVDEAAAELGIPVEDVLRVWVEEGLRPGFWLLNGERAFPGNELHREALRAYQEYYGNFETYARMARNFRAHSRLKLVGT